VCIYRANLLQSRCSVFWLWEMNEQTSYGQPGMFSIKKEWRIRLTVPKTLIMSLCLVMETQTPVRNTH